MISKGRTESSEGKRDCREKLTNCAKRKATPVSQVDFLLPVGAKVRSQAEAARCTASCAAGSFFFFFWPARGRASRALPLDPLLYGGLYGTATQQMKRRLGNVDDSEELGDDEGQGTKELASCQASAGWSRRRGVCQDTYLKKLANGA